MATVTTNAEIIDAIRANHLRANIAEWERRGALIHWGRAWVDRGGALFGPGPYLHVPVRDIGASDDAVIRVFPPERLRRRLAKQKETKINWTKLGASIFANLPKIQRTIEAVKGLKGPDKKAAAINAITNGLDVAESLTDRRILSDPRVQAAIGKANDIAVEVQNVVALVTAEHAGAQ